MPTVRFDDIEEEDVYRCSRCCDTFPPTTMVWDAETNKLFCWMCLTALTSERREQTGRVPIGFWIIMWFAVGATVLLNVGGC